MELAQPNKTYHTTHDWVYSCQYHVVFCPKYRRRVLTDGIDERLQALIIETQAECGYEVLEIEIMPDHVQTKR